MRVRVLGCSGGIGTDRKTTSLLVDDDLLIDAGSGLGQLLLDEMGKIRHVFLTHSHLDHVAALPLFLDSVFDRLTEPVTVYGRKETLEALRTHIFNWVVWPDFAALPSPERPVLRFEELAPGESRQILGRSIEMLPANHAVPAAAYRVECPGGAFAFSGDTTSNDGLWRALNAHPRLDLLIVESAFPERSRELAEVSRHYCPSLLAADLAKLRHRPAVYVTHLKPGVESEIYDQCRRHIAGLNVNRLYDGEVFQL